MFISGPLAARPRFEAEYCDAGPRRPWRADHFDFEKSRAERILRIAANLVGQPGTALKLLVVRERSHLIQSMMDCYGRHNRSMARLNRITILGAEAAAPPKDRCRRLVRAELAGAHLIVVHVDEADGLAMTRAHLETPGSFDAIAH